MLVVERDLLRGRHLHFMVGSWSCDLVLVWGGFAILLTCMCACVGSFC